MERLRKRAVFLGVAGMLILSGCRNQNVGQETGTAETELEESVYGDETTITGNGEDVSITGRGAAADQGVVTITSAGAYRLQGEITDGQIVIDAGKEDEINLILDGFTISSQTSSAIYGIQSGCITITTEEGTENFVSDGEIYQLEAGEDEPDAAIFSKDDLILEGGGTLTVSGNYACGIRGKDDLTVLSGTYMVDSVKDAIKGKDSVAIEGGTITVTAGEDGIQASNDEAEDKGYVKISGGTITVAAAAKGIKGYSLVEISGGTIDVDSEDDGIHSNGDVKIYAGTCTIASGDDGIHADNHVVINDGTITVAKSYEGIEGLSIDINGGVVDVVSEDDGLNAAGGADGSGNMEFGMAGRPGGENGEPPEDSQVLPDANKDSNRGIEVQNTPPDGESRGRMMKSGGGAFGTTEGAYIRITGGDITIKADGDGIDSNGDFYQEGGSVVVEGPTDNGNGTLDYDGTGTITGGIFAGTGSSGMLKAFSEESGQCVIVAYFGETVTAGTEWKLLDSAGNVVMAGNPTKDFTSLIVSTPDVKEGETYQLIMGEESTEITVSDTITQSGNPTGGSGMGKGRMGGGERPAGNGSVPGSRGKGGAVSRPNE